MVLRTEKGAQRKFSGGVISATNLRGVAHWTSAGSSCSEALPQVLASNPRPCAPPRNPRSTARCAVTHAPSSVTSPTAMTADTRSRPDPIAGPVGTDERGLVRVVSDDLDLQFRLRGLLAHGRHFRFGVVKMKTRAGWIPARAWSSDPIGTAWSSGLADRCLRGRLVHLPLSLQDVGREQLVPHDQQRVSELLPVAARIMAVHLPGAGG